jgi:hypothetical protein
MSLAAAVVEHLMVELLELDKLAVVMEQQTTQLAATQLQQQALAAAVVV